MGEVEATTSLGVSIGRGASGAAAGGVGGGYAIPKIVTPSRISKPNTEKRFQGLGVRGMDRSSIRKG
jgi:hypothetical protein